MVGAMIPAVLAAGFDWVEGLLPLLFLLFWIVSQVVNVIRKVAAAGEPKRPEMVRPLPPRRPEFGGDAAAPVDDRRAVLERQIEEFLRRGQPGRGAAPTPPPLPAAKPQPERRTKDRGPRPAALDTAARAEGSRLQPSPVRQQQVAERRLGAGLADSGPDVARHVHDAFAHEIGGLASSIRGHDHDAAPAPPRPTPTAADFLELLRNPQSMRHLILLREVLDRPVDRW